MELPSSETSKVVLHVDCDEFFLQVHERADPRIANEIRQRPCAVWQYNDVICANAAAKRAGVKKHQRPHEARALLEPLGGRMVHAYWRQWPGQRVVYTPYQAAGRAVFEDIERFLESFHPEHAFVVERTSIDECYIDCTDFCTGLVERGDELAQRLKRHLMEGQNIRVSVGVSFNRLLAKLASAQAKKDSSADRVKVVPHASFFDFLGSVPASKLPGLGQKGAELARLSGSKQETVESKCSDTLVITDLQRFSAEELREGLRLKSDAMAQQVWEQCRGACSLPVQKVSPPKSVVVTSWMAGARLGDLISTQHLGRGGPAVVVGAGKWVFEPHHLGEAKSNSTRPRWILLALALDLAERVLDHREAHDEVPTSITVGFNKPGRTRHWDDKGTAHSRSLRLPSSFVALLQRSDKGGRFSDAWSRRSEWCSGELKLNGIDVDHGHSVLEFQLDLQTPSDNHHVRCVGGFVDAAASTLQALITQEGADTTISQLTLTALNFRPVRPRSTSANTLQGWLAQSAPQLNPAPKPKPRALEAPSVPKSEPSMPKSERSADNSEAEPETPSPRGLSHAGLRRQPPSQPLSPPRPRSHSASCSSSPATPNSKRKATGAIGVGREAWEALPAHIQEELAASPSSVLEQGRMLAACRSTKRQRMPRLESFFQPLPGRAAGVEPRQRLGD